MNLDLTEEIQELQCKVKILHGLIDSVMPFENTVEWKSILKDRVEVKGFANGIHMVHE